MAKNKFTLKLTAFLMFIIILTISSFVFMQQTFYGNVVWLPNFGNMECRGELMQPQAPVSLSGITDGTISWNGDSYVCGANAYTPFGCSYIVSVKAGTIGQVWNCDINSNNCESSPLRNWDMELRDEQVPININYGRRMYINPDRYLTFLSPKMWTIQERSEVYRLVQTDRGYLAKAKDCTISSLNGVIVDILDRSRGYNTVLDIKGNKVLAAGQIVNYIESRSQAESNNVITRADVNGGQPIYIPTAGAYYKIVRGEKGEYADTQSELVYDSKIECLPANKAFCTPDAKMRTTEPVACGLGVAPGYNLPGNNVGEWCKATCTAGLQIASSDCKTIPTKCPPGAPLLDPQTLECVGSNTLIVQGADYGKYIPWIVGGIFLIFLIIVVTKVNTATKGSSKKK